MKHLIDPGRTRPSIFHFDHIVYSHVEDLNGDPLALELSILSPMEGKELQIALGRKKPEENPDARTDGAVGKAGVNQRPVIVWFNGNGFREVDKHCQIGDLAFLAEAGYAVCFVQFRNSAQGKLPGTADRRQNSDPVLESTCSPVFNRPERDRCGRQKCRRYDRFYAGSERRPIPFGGMGWIFFFSAGGLGSVWSGRSCKTFQRRSVILQEWNGRYQPLETSRRYPYGCCHWRKRGHDAGTRRGVYCTAGCS